MSIAKTIIDCAYVPLEPSFVQVSIAAATQLPSALGQVRSDQHTVLQRNFDMGQHTSDGLWHRTGRTTSTARDKLELAVCKPSEMHVVKLLNLFAQVDSNFA